MEVSNFLRFKPLIREIKMKAAVWHGREDIRVVERELKPLKDHEITIRVAWAGICGSDLHEYVEGHVFIPNEKEVLLNGGISQLTILHEFTVILVAVGSDITLYIYGTVINVNPRFI